MIDFSAFTAPINDQTPCGDDLEYSEDFLKLQQLVESSDGQKPNWPAAYELSTKLLKQTRDLRLASVIVQSLTALEGITSLSSSLSLIEGLLSQLWDSVYPPLEGTDIAYRLKAIHEINSNEFLLFQIRQTAFLPDTNRTKIRIRDIEKLDTLHSGNTLSLEQLQQHIQTQHDQALTLAASLEMSIECCKRIEHHLPQSTDHLQKLLSIVLKYLPKVVQVESAENDPAQHGFMQTTDPAAEEHASHEVLTTLSSNSQQQSVQIRSRADIARLLDLMCEYLAEHEPSNPAPLLLQRAKKTLGLTFLEVIEELNPDGLAQIKRLAGL